mmetsp:Transcript_649/g.1315  ORF Transcript_649/g.1315 Transcript_649/m.1315 type:complete len:214 (-) Transcript_649:113-754(-)
MQRPINSHKTLSNSDFLQSSLKPPQWEHNQMLSTRSMPHSLRRWQRRDHPLPPESFLTTTASPSPLCKSRRHRRTSPTNPKHAGPSSSRLIACMKDIPKNFHSNNTAKFYTKPPLSWKFSNSASLPRRSPNTFYCTWPESPPNAPPTSDSPKFPETKENKSTSVRKTPSNCDCSPIYSSILCSHHKRNSATSTPRCSKWDFPPNSSSAGSNSS